MEKIITFPSTRPAYQTFNTGFAFEESFLSLKAMNPMSWLCSMDNNAIQMSLSNRRKINLQKVWDILEYDLKKHIACWMQHSDLLHKLKMLHERPQFCLKTKTLVENTNMTIGLREAMVSWFFGMVPTTSSSPDCIDYFGQCFELKTSEYNKNDRFDILVDNCSLKSSDRTLTSRFTFKIEGSRETVVAKCSNGLVWSCFADDNWRAPDWVVEISAEHLLNDLILIDKYTAKQQVNKTISANMIMTALETGGAKDLSEHVPGCIGFEKSFNEHYRTFAQVGFVDTGLIDFDH
jgi:hypothetical protein